MQEFICPNGRLSVNGVCPIFEGDDGQIKDIIKTSTDETLSDRLAIKAPTTDFNTTKPQINISSKIPETDFNTTKPQINISSKISDSDNRLNYIENINKQISPEQDEKLKELKKDREKDNFFKFDFEKETPSAKKTAGNIISENIGTYNDFVENKLGIPSSIQNVARVGSAISGFGTYGVIGAIAPFAIPFVAGAALNNKAEQQAAQQQNFVDAAAAKRNIQQYTSGGGGGNQSSPARTSQGVTSAQHAAFRS